MALLWSPKLAYSLVHGSGTDGQRHLQMRLQRVLAIGTLSGSCACRRCRRKSTAAASGSRRGSAAGRRCAPWWCAPLRRRCRYAAGPRDRSRSRTALRSASGARPERPVSGLPRTARRARSARARRRRGRGSEAGRARQASGKVREGVQCTSRRRGVNERAVWSASGARARLAKRRPGS